MNGISEPAAPAERASTAVALTGELRHLIAETVRREVDQALARRSRKLALLVTSGELDKLMVAAIVAAGAAAMDFEVNVFFAFWGLSAIRAYSCGIRSGFLRESDQCSWVNSIRIPGGKRSPFLRGNRSVIGMRRNGDRNPGIELTG